MDNFSALLMKITYREFVCKAETDIIFFNLLLVLFGWTMQAVQRMITPIHLFKSFPLYLKSLF